LGVKNLASEEYTIIVEFPTSVLFGVNSKKYVTKICLSDSLITLREVLKKLNDEFIKSTIFESYLEGGSGFLVFVNNYLVKDIDGFFKKLIEPNTTNIEIKILPIFEGG